MWKFLWYPDGSRDPWQRWYDLQDYSVRGRHDATIKILCGQEAWKEPWAKKLSAGKDLVEIIIKTKVQHRLLGFYGEGRQFTIVMACTHKQKIYNPPNAIETAIKRMNEVKSGKVTAIHCDKPK